MQREHPWLDASQAPLYVLRYPANVAELVADAPAFVEVFRAFWRGVDHRIAIVTDLTSLTDAPASLRRGIAEADNEAKFKQRDFLVAWAVVIARPVQRLLFQGYLWMAPPATPYRVFSQTNEAIAWAHAQLRAAGVVVPSATHEVLRAANEFAQSTKRRSKN